MVAAKKFTVTGMSCGHCENAVRDEVGGLHGVAQVQVSAAAGSLAVTLQDEADVTDEAILAAVEEAGYQGQVGP